MVSRFLAGLKGKLKMIDDIVDSIVYEPKNKKRALRRHHRDRLKSKARKILKRWDIPGKQTLDTPERVGKWHNNLARCSCYMCGNPRKYGERTLQERKNRWVEVDYWNEDITEEYLYELWGFDEESYTGYCSLCEKEFMGVCDGCGYRPFWWNSW